MRLNPDQIEIIRLAARDAFGPGAEVFLFGSRVDDNKRGGDVDLLVHPDKLDRLLIRKIRFLGLLERRMGDRKVDVVIEVPGDVRPIVQVARETGVLL